MTVPSADIHKISRLLFLLIDIVSYSKMQDKDQKLVVAHLHDLWNDHVCQRASEPDLLRPAISIGDGFIFSGQDSLQVLELFMHFIIRLVKEQRELPAEKRYSTHFALHSGECFIIGDNVLGNPVNELARIESCALDSQVLASKAFWKRLLHYCKTDWPSFSSEDVFYDAYLVKFKHDRYLSCDPRVNLESCLEDRIVHNLIFPAGTKLNVLPFEIGNPSPPANSIWYTTDNNYHHRYQSSRNNFIFRSEEELFRYHCSKYNETLMCFPFFGHIVRLPFTVEYAVQQNRKLSLEESVTTDFNPVEQELLIKITREGRKRRQEHYLMKSLVCLRKLEAVEADLSARLRLHVAKCEYAHYVSTNLAADWIPNNGNFRMRQCLRDVLTEHPGLPKLDNPELANPIGASAWIVSKDKKLVVQTRSRGGLHFNLGGPSISASGSCVWKDIFELQGKNLPDDRALCELLGRTPVSADRGIIRQTWEELRISVQDIRSLRLLGIAREFYRLGKPEFFYLMKVNLDYDTICKLARKASTSWEHEGIDIESLQLHGEEPNDWVEQLLKHLVEVPFNPITKAGLFFLICNGHGKLPVPSVTRAGH